MDSRDKIKLFFLFALTYIILFFLPALTNLISPDMALHDWFAQTQGFTFNVSLWDYTFILLPFVGFFFLYFLVDWVNEYFETKFASTVYFPLLFVVLSFMAFYVQLMWYYGNIVSLSIAQGQQLVLNIPFLFDSTCGPGAMSFYSTINNQTTLNVCYWNVLRNDAFLVFVFSGLAGLISNKVMKRFSEQALEEKRKIKTEIKTQPEQKKE